MAKRVSGAERANNQISTSGVAEKNWEGAVCGVSVTREIGFSVSSYFAVHSAIWLEAGEPAGQMRGTMWWWRWWKWLVCVVMSLTEVVKSSLLQIANNATHRKQNYWVVRQFANNIFWLLILMVSTSTHQQIHAVKWHTLWQYMLLYSDTVTSIPKVGCVECGIQAEALLCHSMNTSTSNPLNSSVISSSKVCGDSFAGCNRWCSCDLSS